MVYILFLLSICTGCWNFERLSERGLVTGMAFDKGNPGYKVGLESIEFGKGKSGEGNTQAGKPYVLVSKTDKESLEGALHGTQYRLVGLAFFPDYRIFIVGKELAQHGIKPIFDHQIRDPDMRRNTQIIIADGSAIDLLKITPKESHFTGEYLEGLVKRNEKAGHVIASDIGKTFRAMVEHGTGLIPIVKMAKDKKGAKVETFAVIKNFKMVDILNHAESEYVTLLRDVYKRTHSLMFSLGIPCKQKKDMSIDADIVKSKVKLEPRIEDNHLTISGKLTLKGYISEFACSNGKMDGNATLENTEKYMAKQTEIKL